MFHRQVKEEIDNVAPRRRSIWKSFRSWEELSELQKLIVQRIQGLLRHIYFEKTPLYVLFFTIILRSPAHWISKNILFTNAAVQDKKVDIEDTTKHIPCTL